MKRQFRLIGLVALVVLSACNSKSKGPDGYLFFRVWYLLQRMRVSEPIIQEEIEVLENLYLWPGLFLAIQLKGSD